MKHWPCFFLLIVLSCADQQHDANNPVVPDAAAATIPDTSFQQQRDICWTGTINGRTPVFIHYSLDSNLIIGEITYLNTKKRLPIKLLGTIEEDKTYRLLEFEPSGNITGIITGTPSGNSFKGTWFSPKTRKELVLDLVKKDSTIVSVDTETQMEDIFGHYHYQYSFEGYQGDMEISRLPNDKAVFGITCVTGEPARNVAQIDRDTITLNSTQFIYSLAGTDDCEFKVRFYKGFAWIQYTKGFCDGQFGMNASIDGIFLKTD